MRLYFGVILVNISILSYIELFNELKSINEKLWDIENEKRLLEKNSDFGDKFVQVSRDVHFMNDKRAKVKKEINRSFGSNIEEVKEYTKY